MFKKKYTQFISGYKRFFHIVEFQESKTLQGIAWALIVGWFLEFSTWWRFSDFTINAVQEGRHLCWPFFQSCGDWYFLTLEPLGNTQGLMYAFLFALLVSAGYLLIKGRYTAVHALFLLLFFWEMTVLLMSMRLAVNYWYFHVFYAALFLFPFGKLTLLRLGAVLLYFFSGILKLNEGWVDGAYFKALSEGLYLVPNALIPVATNAVIFMEMALVWFLLGKERIYRMVVLALLFVFHVYSVVYVGYVYPSIVLPVVLILFLSDEKSISLRKIFYKKVAGPLLLSLFFVIHVIPYAIEGNAHITGEGNKYGMYMFETNYQCVSSAMFHYTNGEVEEHVSESHYAIQRCDPYTHYFYFKQLCAANGNIDSIEWDFDTSLNGSDLFRIVEVENACELRYKAFQHNKWIQPSFDGLEPVGVVTKNNYRP